MNIRDFNDIEVSDPKRISNLLTNARGNTNGAVKYTKTDTHFNVTVISNKGNVSYRIPIRCVIGEQLESMTP